MARDRLYGLERSASFRGEELEKRPHGASSENEADEKQDRAEKFIPLQVHEVEDDEHELHRGKYDERGNDQPLRERQVDQDDFYAGNDREEHRDLDEDVEFALAVSIGMSVRVVVRFGSVGGGVRGHDLEVFEEIDGGENHDPDDVDEVPVKAHRLDIDGVGFAEIDGAFVAAQKK